MHVRDEARSGSRRSILGAPVAMFLFALAVLGATAPNASAEPPTVTIENAADVGFTVASVAGTVDPDGSETYYRFEAATEADFSNVSVSGAFGSVAPGAGVTEVPPPGELLTGLAPETTYHLRLVAESPEGNDIAVAPATFTTKGPIDPPTVTIGPVADFDSSTAHFSGSINPGSTETDPGFRVNWHFECTPACPSFPNEAGSIDADEADHPIEADVSGLQPNTSYEVRLVASNAGGSPSASTTFSTTAVAPYARTLPAFALEGGTDALLGARLNPANQATDYRFEYGTTAAYGQAAPAGSPADAGEGGETQVVTESISGLQPNTVYHFRVVAENATGETEGDDKTFVTAPLPPALDNCPNQAVREENNSAGLPDCRAYEQVSPLEKNGYDAATSGSQAAADGNGIAFESFGAFSDENEAALIVNPYLSRRGPGGWTTHPLAPGVKGGANAGFSSLFQFYTPNLEFAGNKTSPSKSLAPGDLTGQDNLYWRDNGDNSYQTLTRLPNGDHLSCSVGFGCVVVAASADNEHVVFQAENQVWEWSDGVTQLVSLLPGEVPTTGKAGPLYGGSDIGVNAPLISEDGSRIVFSSNDELNGAVDLYMRIDGDHTVRISDSQRTTTDPRPNFSIFVGASSDLSRVFFLDGRALTDDAAIGSQSLYMYEVESGELTNLSADANPDDDGVVITEIVGLSEDGSRVYFLSPNQLLEGTEGLPGEYNIYLWDEGELSLAIPGVEHGSDAVRRSQDHVSADGRFLLHGDSNRITAYDNREAGTDAPLREYYLYDAEADRLTCVSCKMSGQRPEGTPDGAASFPDNPPRQQGHVPVAITDDGSRVFFQSRDAIVPEDVNARQDVYLWENGLPHLVSTGQGGNPSQFAGAGRDGDDVFFTTRERLSPADLDNSLDIYDARVGGGFPYVAPQPPCEGEAGCRGPVGTPPPATNPASETFESDVRPLDPNRQRLKKALRTCRKKPSKRARAKCRKKAKKRLRAGSTRRAQK